ncbi:MAG: hypothetical protein ACP5XB_29435, partial [Isosphaeraceae bacterium]
MTELEAAAQPAMDTELPPSPQPEFSWDSSVEAVPISRGWDAEPCIVDWDGTGRPALLVSSGGGSPGRSLRLYRPLADPGSGDHPCFDGGTPLPELHGLRSLCSIPNPRPSRFDLVALSDAGLVHLPNSGTPREPSFGPRISLGLGPNLGIDHAQTVQMTAVDWDSDGLVDLLVGIHDLEGYWPDADRLPATQIVGLNQRAGHPGYDRDGRWRGRAPVGRIFW